MILQGLNHLVFWLSSDLDDAHTIDKTYIHYKEEEQFFILALRQPWVRNISDLIFLALVYHLGIQMQEYTITYYT